MSAAEVKAWAVVGPDGDILPATINESEDLTWASMTHMFDQPRTYFETAGYTCEPVTILRGVVEGVTLPALKALRERIEQAYGHLPNDVPPGPPNGILQTLDAMLAASPDADGGKHG